MNVFSLRLMLVSAGSAKNHICFGYLSTVLQVFNYFLGAKSLFNSMLYRHFGDRSRASYWEVIHRQHFDGILNHRFLSFRFLSLQLLTVCASFWEYLSPPKLATYHILRPAALYVWMSSYSEALSLLCFDGA